jgi:hypothetical protein
LQKKCTFAGIFKKKIKKGDTKMDDNYRLDIRKEVLNETLAGTAARYYHYACELGVSGNLSHPVTAQEMEILSLKNKIRDAGTMDELENISNRLLAYNLSLNKMRNAPQMER